MRRLLIVLILLPVALSAQSRARNVILFVADAGGISTLAAASLHGYGAPRRLFIQRMPHIGLSATTTASQIVSDSAAGMTAIVTGERTHNGVVAQSAGAVRGKIDGEPLKTILEYAEERGLSTGIITNDSPAGATPAALYAKANNRSLTAVIFQQLFAPRFGDGVDVVIAGGRGTVAKALAEAGLELESLGRDSGRPVLGSLSEIPAGATRALTLHESGDFDLDSAIDLAVGMLSRNRRGYFLMVEWDAHTDSIRRGLDRMVALDRAIERRAKLAGRETLLVFTADHSFDIQLRGGLLGQPLLEGLEKAEEENPKGPIRIPAVRMDSGHTGEEVLVAARGPGAERVRGYMANTDIFRVMMAAYGWPLPKSTPARGKTPP
ncbi:MAG: alkaline phosphatase [Acidobacteria bacterium]|nr:alkaline phosphatase [Acidobacteriota bacterium]